MSHPPHLTSSWSSSFIPFCAFKTDLNFSKNSLPLFLEGTDFPLCTSFLPTILEGQLCYKLNVNDTSGQGKKNELMMILDYNEDRSLQLSLNDKKDLTSSNQTLNFDTSLESVLSVSAKIQIDTISSYIGFGGGMYMMTDVKRMTAKEDFLRMSLKDRNCEVEPYEDCRTRKLLEECNCHPWEVPGQKYQVNLLKRKHFTAGACRSVSQREETALRGTLSGLSTAVLHARASMPPYNGLEKVLMKIWTNRKLLKEKEVIQPH